MYSTYYEYNKCEQKSNCSYGKCNHNNQYNNTQKLARNEQYNEDPYNNYKQYYKDQSYDTCQYNSQSSSCNNYNYNYQDYLRYNGCSRYNNCCYNQCYPTCYCCCCTCCPEPIKPKPCSTNQNLHIGVEGSSLVEEVKRSTVDIQARDLALKNTKEAVAIQAVLEGPTGTFPFDATYASNGTDISGLNPVLLAGNHTYLVEWSGAINPKDVIGTIDIQLLLDGNTVSGSGNRQSVASAYDGLVPVSGGAIINVPEGSHTLQLQYVTGQTGLSAENVNMRIIELI